MTSKKNAKKTQSSALEYINEPHYCGSNHCKYLETFLHTNDQDLPTEYRSIKNEMFYDPQYQLPNRLKLLFDIKESTCAVLFKINIDGFAQINNLFGTEVGDHVLKHVAHQLEQTIQKNHILYKLPADEFAILMEISNPDGTPPNCEQVDWELLNTTAQNIINAIIADHITVATNEAQNTYEIVVNATIGIAVTPVVGKEDLYTRADIALKTARQKRKSFMYYRNAGDARKQYKKNIYWARMIKTALKNDTIIPYYQPIQNNWTGQIEKYEALARMVDPNGKLVSPYSFLSLSKALRLYPFITRNVVNKSFTKFQKRTESISINIDTEDINNPDIVGFLMDSVKEHGIGERVTFEILESEGIENYDEVAHFIKKVKSLGCKIAIDDFGTGFSNFSHILSLQIDYLKIDASLIKNILEDKNAGIIVRTIVGFAREIGFETIGEFVHSQLVHQHIKKLGVDYAQGYYIGKPTDQLP